ncbi:MAG: family 1 glycosylhydrolase, partial [Dehalococcoidia bacterium]
MEESAEKPNEEIEREIMEELSKEPAMMKNKKHVLGILAITILISGMVGYAYSEKGGALATPQSTIAVNSTSDSGPGTLRRALLEAQSGDTITFDPAVFPPEAPATIYLTSSLPPITQGDLTIDGSNAGVVLDGSTITDERANGLEIASDGNIIRGLQIISFPNAAVGLLGGAQNSTVGGDRVVGAGPLGQGNLLSGNGSFGVGIWDADTSFNTIIGNYVGTDLSGTAAWGIRRDGVHINGASHNQVIHNLISGNGQSGVYICCTGEGNTIRDNHIGTDISGLNPLGNLQFGVAIDWGARDNVIGRDNIIAHNNVDGIAILGSNSLGNTITRNSIHDNGRQGIYLWEGGNTDLPAPLIFDFALDAGTVTGAACANCAVEIFSDNTDEGEIYEGRTIADSLGVITFNKGVSFTGPHLTATATDADGNTSPFSAPTSGTSRSTNLQEGNNLPKTRLEPKQSRELEDNRIGDMWSLERIEEWNLDQVINTGLKWVRVSIDWMDWIQVESTGAYSEYYVDPEQDNAITDLADNGIKIMYVLVYWDEAIQVEEGYSRFKTEEEIQRYLDYVQFIVHHFKDRIEYYEILNEPNIDKDPSSQQYVELDDYINLVKRTVPVIREEHPEAKIVVGAFTPFLEYRGPDIAPLLEFEYFFGILSSDVMPLVDAVSWHAMSGTSPEYGEEYYYNYPSLLQEIKDVASSRGFEGEYIAEELHWLTPMNPSPNEYSEYSETTAAKYLARGIVMHLGTDITTGLAETGHELQIPKMRVIRNLCTIMAGAEPVSLPAEIQSEATNIRSYSFSLPNGDTLIALWTDGVAVEEDPGVKT